MTQAKLAGAVAGLALVAAAGVISAEEATEPSGAQLFERIADDSLVVLELQRHDPKLDVEPLAHRAGVGEVLLPGAITEVVKLVLKPYLEVECGDGESLADELGKRCRAVYATGEQKRVALCSSRA